MASYPSFRAPFSMHYSRAAKKGAIRSCGGGDLSRSQQGGVLRSERGAVGGGVLAAEDAAGTAAVFAPVTQNQRNYVAALNNRSLPAVLAVGAAGTGKTMLACQSFYNHYLLGNYQKLVITRPSVCVDGEEFGFLPGDIHQKMAPWTLPIFDSLGLYFTPLKLNQMVKNKIIDVVPLTFMRGRTFHDSFVLADEMQNSSPAQMLTLLTRLGMNSKLVITGDLSQSDLRGENGLVNLLQKYRTRPIPEIALIELGSSDVQRSSFVRRILDYYSGAGS